MNFSDSFVGYSGNLLWLRRLCNVACAENIIASQMTDTFHLILELLVIHLHRMNELFQPGVVARSVACSFCMEAPPKSTFVFGKFFHLFLLNFFPLPLIQEEQVVSYWQKNGHLILVDCLWVACP